MDSLKYFNWDVSPVLFSFGNLSIGWYGVLFASGFFFGFHLMRWVYAREGKSLASLDTIFIYMVLGAVLGGRLGHCLFYDPGFYLSNPLEILKIWQGGLASHGGTVGMLIAVYVYVKQTPGISFYWILDRITLPVALGSFTIRCGNFFNSEILGIPTNVPWAIVFSRIDNLPRHPAQLYEAIVYLLLLISLLLIYKKQGAKLKPGYMMGVLMIVIFGSRFFIEFVKIPQESFEPIFSLNMGQWLSLPFVIMGIYFMYFNRVKLSKEIE